MIFSKVLNWNRRLQPPSGLRGFQEKNQFPSKKIPLFGLDLYFGGNLAFISL